MQVPGGERVTEKESVNPKKSPETAAKQLREVIIGVGTIPKERQKAIDTKGADVSAKQLQGMVSSVATLPKGQDKLFEAAKKGK